MTITITSGWWMLPTVVTLIAWAWAISTTKTSTSVLGIIDKVIYGAAAVIVSAIAWLIWALCRIYG